MLQKVFLALAVILSFSLVFGAGVSLVESSSEIENETLVIELLFVNSSSFTKNVSISINYFGQEDFANEAIPAETTKKVDYAISNFSEGKVKIHALTDEEYFLVINVPADWENGIELEVSRLNSFEEFESVPAKKNIIQDADSFLKRSFGREYGLIAAVLFALVLFAYLGIKTLFKKKTPAEETRELTSEMLSEIEAIENLRKKK